MSSFEDNNLPSGEIILQIISSIRTLDGRIDEIKQGILNEYFTPAVIEQMKERMKRLIETRMMIVYSLFDNRIAFNKYLGEDTRLTYENLKREIGQ